MSDTSGEYHLADGEEIVSHLYGDAAAYRHILDALNRGEGVDSTN